MTAEIGEGNDINLVIPRHVGSLEGKGEIDEIDSQLAEARGKTAEYLKELELLPER